MQKLVYTGISGVAFPPVTTIETTTTGQEAWRTAIRMPSHYGVLGIPSRAVAPTKIGSQQLERLKLMQPANPRLPYNTAMSQKEGEN